MAKGLWAITFETPDWSNTGGGVVIFDAAHLYGGDAGFLLFRHLHDQPQRWHAHRAKWMSAATIFSAVFIFPALNGGTFHLSGKLTKPVTILKAHLLQYP